MINFIYANQNILKYKFDYQGYLVIVDKIRTKDIILENNPQKMSAHLNILKEKYKTEIEKIKGVYSLSDIKEKNARVKYELEYLVHILPAIGFIKLGLGKLIGLDK